MLAALPRRATALHSTALAIALLVGSFADYAQTVRAQLPDTERFQQQLYTVVEQTSRAIVEVHRRDVVFSGVIVSPDGYVLTAGHTIEPGNRYTIHLPDGRRMVGMALGTCDQTQPETIDCGLIRIIDAIDLPYVPMGNASNLEAGQACISISYPGGQRKKGEPLVRLGSVGRNGGRTNRNGRMLQTTALMEPGDSGGPLLDFSGRVIGIHSRIGMGQSQNYDVPIELFKNYWDALNVSSEFHSLDGRPMPMLGFVGRSNSNGDGILIVSIEVGGIADQCGFQANDILTKIDDQALESGQDIQFHLASALESQVDPISVAVLRAGELKEVLLPSARFSYPKADRIEGIETTASSKRERAGPASSSELRWLDMTANVDASKAALSSQWSTACVKITSRIHGSTENALATRIEGSKYLISKNSIVGESAFIREGSERIELAVVVRDFQQDLVLLKSPHENTSGVRIDSVSADDSVEPRLEVVSAITSHSATTKQGQLIFSPTPTKTSWLSVVGSSEFESQRLESRGYLGVMLQTDERGGALLTQVEEGAARRAGLQIGDVITQVDETPIRRREDIQRHLASLDPLTKVAVQIRRGPEQRTIDVTLGEFPSMSDHAADLMSKSKRRDGFPTVFCHDATLQPSQCGGPVFDLHGNWIGVNIARYSRVRTFAIPASEVMDFVRRNTQEADGRQ